MPKQLRIDDLGHETHFVVVNHLTLSSVRVQFERLITEYALGYTRLTATGGWKGKEELVFVYRVASLSNPQRRELVLFLLNNTDMKDVYVVLPGGKAHGYCYEETDEAVDPTPLHGTRRTGWREDRLAPRNMIGTPLLPARPHGPGANYPAR